MFASGVLKAIGGIASGVMSAIENRRERERIEREHRERQAELDAKKSEGAFADGSTNEALARVDEDTRNAVNMANGRSKITGDFSGAEMGKAQAAGSRARGMLLENALSYHRRKRDRLDLEDRRLKADYALQQKQLHDQKNQNIQNMAMNAFNAAGDVLSTLDFGGNGSGGDNSHVSGAVSTTPTYKKGETNNAGSIYETNTLIPDTSGITFKENKKKFGSLRRAFK